VAPGGISTANTTVAFTPLINATAMPEAAAARRGEPRVDPRTSGTSTHGKKTVPNIATEESAYVTTMGATV
jgi:hypothetical protein